MATRLLLNPLWIGQAIMEGAKRKLDTLPQGICSLGLNNQVASGQEHQLSSFAQPKKWNPLSKVVVHHKRIWMTILQMIKLYIVAHLTKSSSGQ